MKLNTIIHGDALEVLKGIPADSFDSCVTDPPYGLGFMGKQWDTFKEGDIAMRRNPLMDAVNTGTSRQGGRQRACEDYQKRQARDMRAFQEWCEAWAREVLRVLKPGAHLLSFGGSRTYHRMACAIEDAGFEIRDQIMWIYGSGFPKSLDISKAIDKAAGYERNIGNKERADRLAWRFEKQDTPSLPPATDAARQWDGWGTSLKPAHEPICVARKPFKGTVAENVLQHGTGGINVDGCRIETQQSRPLIISKNGDSKACFGQGLNNSWQDPAGTILGRFPANVIHDGSEEVVRLFPEVKAGANVTGEEASKAGTANCYSEYGRVPFNGYADNGSAARFFYCAKASRDERGPGNNHPTVKPLALIQYLVKLVTPPGGIILDPFMGSGTLGIAAGKLGMKWVGIELNEKYIEIAERRIEREVGLLLNMEAAHAD